MTRKHVKSEKYNDPKSEYNRMSEERKELARERARRQQEQIRRFAPKVPNRPWSRPEMKNVFLSKLSLLNLAIAMGRNYDDVASLSRALTEQYNEQPAVLFAFLELEPIEIRSLRVKNREQELKDVCDECFTVPHQISCSQEE